MKKPKPTTKPAIEKLVMPDAVALERLGRDLRLDPAGLHELRIELQHIVQDQSDYADRIASAPSRDDLVRRLKRIEKAMRALRRELDLVDPDQLNVLMPRAAEDYLARSLTSQMIAEAVGDITAELILAPLREAISLQCSGELLRAFISGVHDPFKRWIEQDRLNKGGRPPDWKRTLVIGRLAAASPLILRKKATVSPTGRFVALCAATLETLGLRTDGIEKAVATVVKRQRELEQMEAEA